MRAVKHSNRFFREVVGALCSQGQVKWHSEKFGLVEDVPAHCKLFGLDDV